MYLFVYSHVCGGVIKNQFKTLIFANSKILVVSQHTLFLRFGGDPPGSDSDSVMTPRAEHWHYNGANDDEPGVVHPNL